MINSINTFLNRSSSAFDISSRSFSITLLFFIKYSVFVSFYNLS
ncbi:MAG: hypothetical protein MRERC_16c005 [Mycoplasmataceae bacterium RC_NB112A]|nr:MAG: hypothetical protein MRERC_16c005 [Mycoplasmataceae bacterium RC_NB112A]